MPKLIKYLPTSTGGKPISVPEVQALVAAAVEKLMDNNVVVMMTTHGALMATQKEDCPDAGKGICSRLPSKVQTGAVVGAVGMIVLLGLGLLFGQIRLRSVRGRLIRLQSEISRARRKAPGDDYSAGG